MTHLTIELSDGVMAIANEDKLRCFVQVPFGFALYECQSIEGDKYDYQHQGVVGDEKEAYRWLDGQDVDVATVHYDRTT